MLHSMPFLEIISSGPAQWVFWPGFRMVGLSGEFFFFFCGGHGVVMPGLSEGLTKVASARLLPQLNFTGAQK